MKIFSIFWQQHSSNQIVSNQKLRRLSPKPLGMLLTSLLMLGLFAFGTQARSQAIVGRAVFNYPSDTPEYGYNGTNQITTNGLLAYDGLVNPNGIAYVDLNDLTVNQASTPIPMGQLSLNKIIGVDGDHVLLSWKLD